MSSKLAVVAHLCHIPPPPIDTFQFLTVVAIAASIIVVLALLASWED